MQRLLLEAKGELPALDDDPAIAKLATAAKDITDDMYTNNGVKSATKKLYGLLKTCDRDIDLPSDEDAAQQKVGTFIAAKRSVAVADMVPLIAKELGFKDEKELMQDKKVAAQRSNVKCLENAPIVAAFQELVELCALEGNRAHTQLYASVVKGLTDIDYIITAENAMGLSKGKTKVGGIGTKSAERILEFLETGTMEKLEAMRAANE
jgi:hypothetical protein